MSGFPSVHVPVNVKPVKLSFTDILLDNTVAMATLEASGWSVFFLESERLK